MTLRYTSKPYNGHGPQQASDPWSRFPSHARSMTTAPITSRPIRLFEPDGKSYWGMHHLGAWREVEAVRDPYGGPTQVRMNGRLINNPICWASS
jgi:hypothetical protein